MGSSTVKNSPGFGKDKVEIELRDIKKVIEDLGLESIDLFKVNIEGGEYPLLDRMIETSIVEKCQYIRVQFHEWYPHSYSLRKKIRKSLLKTQ